MSMKNNNIKSRTAPPEVRRKQLIDATINCIATLGISGTTLTAVTKEAGLSLGLVNFHFKSKDALLIATLEFLANEHRDIWKKSIEEESLSSANKLAAIVEAQFNPKISTTEKQAVWFAFCGDPNYRKTFKSISSEVDAERHEITKRLCRDILSKEPTAGIEPETLAATLESLFDGYWLNMLLYPNDFTPRDGAKLVLTYLGGILPDHFGDRP